MSSIYARSESPPWEIAAWPNRSPLQALLSSFEPAARKVRPYREGPFCSQSGRNGTTPIRVSGDLSKENVSIKSRSKRGSETSPV
ncbi:hypothetical protein AXF42_Ash002553 [Apostasia shenzhenica]|uniref:Uncharacterized protein n=1 Tax=Apostasia shenzhenica TaxID=1088818 RepID=A0A2I0ANW2_9ASPA|nr:hypothetical protein AXF42_Ash002553 [Apostasia shenzhenica]